MCQARAEKVRDVFIGALAPIVVMPEGDASSEGVVWFSDLSAANLWSCPSFVNLSQLAAFPRLCLLPWLGSGAVQLLQAKWLLWESDWSKTPRLDPIGKEDFCCLIDLAEAAFINISEDQPNARIESDLEACCRYQRMGGLEANA